MKLLLDEMWSPAVAGRLRERGHHVASVAEDENLRSIEDRDLLAFATEQGRAIVTENAVDFRAIVDAELTSGRSHAGLIYTSPTTFFRGDPRSIGRLVLTLEALLLDDLDMTDRENWLRPPRS